MQKKNRFDRETLLKIAKGALYALSSPFALQVADWGGGRSDTPLIPLWAKVLVWGVPVGVNAVKEFIKGQPQEKVLNE